MPLAPLAGFHVGLTADRRADEQAELLRRRGAKVLHGPAVRTLPLADDAALRAATDDLIARPPEVVVLLTGVGTRSWLGAADGAGVGEALRHALGPALVLARGPKAAGAALAAGLRVDWHAPGETGEEVRARLLDEGVAGRRVAGRRVAVQRDGSPEPGLAAALTDAGADVVDVPVYRWTLPVDLAPAARLVEAACDRRLDAVTFTAAPAVANLVAIAEEAGRAGDLRAALSGPVRAVCVGPVCAAAARSHGMERVVEPRRPRLGAMVQALVHDAEGSGLRFVLGGAEVVLQGDTALVGERTVELSPRERDLLAALARRAGRVVPKDELLAELWGGGDAHTVEVTVGRLRRRLGPAGRALRAVPRRGYVLEGAPLGPPPPVVSGPCTSSHDA